MAKHQYVLDLTKAALPSWWPKNVPLIIPIEKGRHQYDWDLIPDKLTAEVYSCIKKIIVKRFKSAGIDYDERLPIGFRTNSIPQGGSIRKESI